MASLLAWTLQDTSIPEKERDPKNWPKAMQAEWANDRGAKAAAEHRKQLVAGFDRVRAALDQVGLLGREQNRPIELSTGEQQRVGIARAIIGKPALLIADEPTGNLDPDLSLEVMNIFKRFNEVGVTVLVASHDVHLIERYGVRRVILEGGRVAGTTEFVTMPDLPKLVAERE